MLTPQIIHEDNHILVVSKPFCMPSQGDETGDLCLYDWVMEYIRKTYNKPGNVYVGLVHRLDRPTGGIMVFAKTSKAAARLSEMFQKGTVKKVYYAVTEKTPNPSASKLVDFLSKKPGTNIVKAYDKPVYGAKEAILTYEVLKTKGERALVAVSPITGRQHQIRVQMSKIGCTLCGDLKYGKTLPAPDKSIALFAKKISFEHPVQKVMVSYEAELPNNWVWADFQ